MYWSFSDAVWIYIVPAICMLALLIYALPRRSRPIVPYFIAVVAFVLLWTILASLERLAVDPQLREWIINALYFPIPFSCAAWFIFGLAYAERRRRLSWKAMVLIFLLPAITAVMALTNSMHGLMFGPAEIDASGPFSVMIRPRYTWFWIHTVYSYATTIAGSAGIVFYVIHQKKIYQQQGFLMACGAIIPLIANAIFLTLRDHFFGIDLTSVAVSIGVLLFAWGIFRFRLLDLMPIARANIVDSMRDLIIVLDDRGRIMDLNPAAVAILNFRHAPSIGEPLAEVLPALFEDLAAPELISQEITLKQNDEDLFFRVHSDPILGRKLNEIGRIIVLTDITALKHKEAALLHARDRAETATRTKSDFLATMSHEIRTPMNGILGFASILRDSNLNTEQLGYLTTIQKSGYTLLSLITDILDFAKIEAGKVAFETQPFLVHNCIEEAIDSVTEQAAVKGVEIAYRLDVNVPDTIEGDAVRIGQVLINLLGNAVKFTDAGEITIQVGCDEIPADDNAPYILQFSVSDTGIGIPLDQQQHIFETFSQVDASIARRRGGTGLGLAICKNLCDLMGGNIWVESTEGTGSTFYFTLSVGAPPTARASTQDISKLKGRSILIASSYENTQSMISMLCFSWGMKVRISSSSDEILSILEQGSVFDVVLLDLNREENLRLATQLNVSSRPLPLVILRTVHETLETTSPAVATWVAKPVKQVVLYRALKEALNLPKTPLKQRGSAFDATLGKRHPLKILVAEDNAVNQQLIGLFFTRMGYQIDIVETGKAAVNAVATRFYDVVFMDIYMPDMDGLEATQSIRSLAQLNHRPRIIAMSASVTKHDQQRCKKAGMDGFVSKPIEMNRLTKIIKSLKPATVTAQS